MPPAYCLLVIDCLGPNQSRKVYRYGDFTLEVSTIFLVSRWSSENEKKIQFPSRFTSTLFCLIISTQQVLRPSPQQTPHNWRHMQGETNLRGPLASLYSSSNTLQKNTQTNSKHKNRTLSHLSRFGLTNLHNIMSLQMKGTREKNQVSVEPHDLEVVNFTHAQ